MMLTEFAVTENEAVQSQVERILHSEELRGSEVLRRLLTGGLVFSLLLGTASAAYATFRVARLSPAEAIRRGA